MPHKDPVKRKEYLSRYRAANKDKTKEYDAERLEDLKQHAIVSITSGAINEQYKWDWWCKEIKRKAPKYPYSDDFSNDIIFTMMVRGCFYCGQLATTIDRIDSTLDHTTENCVGCCYGCNVSKGVTDSATFIRKSYYRARREYVDKITSIWFINKQKPNWCGYKKRAQKQGVPFELTKKDWEFLINGDCEYCKRTPVTWFGVDRINPDDGYVNGNVVSCCWDCNLDKHVNDIYTTMVRNERIAVRVDTGNLFIDDCKRMILHGGTHKSSKKVCAYGKVYPSKAEASRALGKSDNYVCLCIKNGWYADDIFEITDEN
jgi:5-methylcytosine-specific restriction endonuclease McrA